MTKAEAKTRAIRIIAKLVGTIPITSESHEESVKALVRLVEDLIDDMPEDIQPQPIAKVTDVKVSDAGIEFICHALDGRMASILSGRARIYGVDNEDD